MIDAGPKPRLVIVSPFLDKRHGTERRVVEWASRLAGAFDVHVYSQRVEDLDLSAIAWHRIPRLPAPHLVNYLWWFAANHVWRAWDRRIRGIRHDLVFSPGVNCLDADAVSVHIVFAQYVSNLRDQLSLRKNSFLHWPRILHRRLYYRLIVSLERRIYANANTPLILIARRTAVELGKFYGRHDTFPVLYLGLDRTLFNSTRRLASREKARRDLGIANGRLALLLVGNDWRNKGVPVLLQSLAKLRELPVDLLLVSQEDPAPVRALAGEYGLDGQVYFLPPRSDIDFYYAAADVYVGPSLEDTFALPPAEAMSCGLPVIVSAENGTSEIITHGQDGLILDNPLDAEGLAVMIRHLWEDPSFRHQIGRNAEATARQYTWDRNGRELTAIFREILGRKTRAGEQTLTQEL